MMKKEFKLLEYLKKEKARYLVKINEASGPFPESSDDQKDDKISEETLDDVMDPTETPAEEMPQNKENVTVSDTKLAMMANIILKAYMAQPADDIPENLQTVTPENANQVIKFVEDKLTLSSPTKKLEDSLTDISNI